jgi:diacylglycerol kinase (ATP)
MSIVPPAAQGVHRIWRAGFHSLAGLRTAWGEAAFRQESLLAVPLLPLSFVLGRDWVQTALLAGAVVLVLIVELLNSAVEATVDRIGPEWHELSRQAKDLGSAAVLLSLVLCVAVWTAALLHRFA